MTAYRSTMVSARRPSQRYRFFLFLSSPLAHALVSPRACNTRTEFTRFASALQFMTEDRMIRTCWFRLRHGYAQVLQEFNRNRDSKVQRPNSNRVSMAANTLSCFLIAVFLCIFYTAKAPSSCGQPHESSPSACSAFWWIHDLLVPINHDMFALSAGSPSPIADDSAKSDARQRSA